MTLIEKLKNRKALCEVEQLCFISLKPRTKEVRIINHSDVGKVVVNKEYIK